VTAPAESRAAQLARARGEYCGTGRRKASVARVRIVPGSGKIVVNDRPVEKFFTELQDRNAVSAPFVRTNTSGMWDAQVRVSGGGHTGQAGAIRLGIARALVASNSEFETVLRGAGFLTRDARRVERKKPGQKKARRRFQFSKR
jgi:small subunit ribosomal protein S9